MAPIKNNQASSSNISSNFDPASQISASPLWLVKDPMSECHSWPHSAPPAVVYQPGIVSLGHTACSLAFIQTLKRTPCLPLGLCLYAAPLFYVLPSNPKHPTIPRLQFLSLHLSETASYNLCSDFTLAPEIGLLKENSTSYVSIFSGIIILYCVMPNV